VGVTGVGGVFLRARDPEALRAWYRDRLGIPADRVLRSTAGDATVWGAFPADTDYFGPGAQAVMINYRVAELDALLARLRDAGVPVDAHIVEEDAGRFGWCTDPEGNRVELWEPAPGW
jgi:predicted enzyme related to lactoylglutathione lyase